MKPIKLSALVDALESESEFMVAKVDLQEGCVVFVDKSVMNAVEENDEEFFKDLTGTAKQEVGLARALVEDPGKRFVDPPDKFEFHEYRHMERFIGTVGDKEAAGQLWRAIKGKGAFRYFKDTANRLGLLKEWFAYRDEALKECVRQWAEAHEIPVVDDTPRERS